MPVGTGGIHFGLEIGNRILKKDWNVLGMIIDDNDLEFYQQRFSEIGTKFINKEGLDLSLLKGPLKLVQASGKGYGMHGDEDTNAIYGINQKYGVYLDPVYMHKAFKGLQKLVRQGGIKENSNVLMIYTGMT